MNDFNAEEILEIACQIERNGARFYKRAAELVSSPDSRKMLGVLAAMEGEHEKFFDKLRADRRVLAELNLDPDGDAVKYLTAIASGEVFPADDDPADALGEDVSTVDVLRKAIDMEMASIAFYQGIREVLPSGASDGKLDKVIREEMRHVTMLTERLFSTETPSS